MKPPENAPIDKATYDSVAAAYGRIWRAALCLCDVDGNILRGRWNCPAGEKSVCREKRIAAVEAAMRWGECAVLVCHRRTRVWAVPLMVNAKRTGALVASALEHDNDQAAEPPTQMDIRAAATALRLLAEKQNLTNAAVLELRRKASSQEKEMAEAIHEFEVAPYDNILAMYLHKENELMAAIRRDDPGQARKIINGMLVAMLQRSGESLNLIKTFFLQLIVSMCRTAVESGGKPEELLGANFQSLQELSQIESDEQLAPWLHRILDHVIDAIRRTPNRPASVPVSAALTYMSQHLTDDIHRDDIARAAHLSPFHFSRLFKECVGVGVRERLMEMRIEKAAEQIVHTQKPLVEIALDCGFKDQSYFTKAFRRMMGTTPKTYRSSHTSPIQPKALERH